MTISTKLLLIDLYTCGISLCNVLCRLVLADCRTPKNVVSLNNASNTGNQLQTNNKQEWNCIAHWSQTDHIPSLFS